MQDNFIVRHSDISTKLGLHHNNYTAIPAALKHGDVEYLKHTLTRFINMNLPYDYKYAFFDLYDNLVIVKLLTPSNKLLFGVVLDYSDQLMEKLAVLDAVDAKEILELL